MSEDSASLHLKVDTTEINKGQKALDDLAKTGEKTQKSINDLGNAAAKMGKATSRLASDIGGLDAATKKAAGSTRDALGATKKLDDELASLLSSINPAYAGLKKFDQGVDTLSRSLKAGIITNQQYASSMSLLESNFAKATVETGKNILHNQRARQSLVSLGNEIATGNFTRMPVTMAALAVHSGISASALFGVAGAAIAVAASIGIATVAAFRGQKEFSAMNNALILSGNYSGLTAGSMHDLAVATSKTSLLTIGSTKDMAIQFASSGQIGAAAFKSVMDAAAAYAQVSGEDADKSASNMVKLFSDPAKGALELNSSMHFLSLAQLANIENLQESGRVTEAQTLLAGLLKAELDKHPATLGAIESAWLNAKKAASSYWDAAMGAIGGRAQSFQEKMDRVKWHIEHASPENKPKFQSQLKALEAEQEVSATNALTEANLKEANSLSQQSMAYAKLHSDIAKRIDLGNKLKLLNDGFMLQTPGTTEAAIFMEAIKKTEKDIAEVGKVKEKISDYQKLSQEISKKNAEYEWELTLGRKVTASEKELIDITAARASGEKKMTDVNFLSLKAALDHGDAIQKQIAANEKLKKVREEIAEIVTSATAANAEHIANLELENSLVGKNALQQQLLRSEYQANLALKREFAQIDKKTLGMTDPAAITKLKAESDGRIQLIKDEAKAKIEARFKSDADKIFSVTGNPLVTEGMGQRLIGDEMAKRTEAANAAHTQALSKLADLDAIHARERIGAELRAKFATAEADAQDIEIARSVGAASLADEAAIKIKEFGADNAEYAAAALAISKDKGLIEQRGLEILNAQLVARVDSYQAEADAATSALAVSKDQLAYDNANLTLQQEIAQIARDSVDIGVAKNLGLDYQAEKQAQLLLLLTQQKNLDMSKVGSGEELIKINKELLDLSEKMSGLDIAAADKAKLKADSAARQVKEALILADTAMKNMWSGMLTQMNNDFRNSFLLMLNNGSATWGTFVKSLANTFKTQVADFIYKQFLTPIVAKVVLSLAGVAGANGLASAATAAANGSQLMGGGVSASSWMNIGTSMWQGFQAAANGIGAGVGGSISAIGNALGNSAISTFGAGMGLTSSQAATAAASYNAAGMSATGSQLTAGSMAGTAASYIGAAAAGITIGTFIAGDKSVFGINGLSSSVIGASIGAAVGGPVGAFIGGVVGGVFNAAFGMGPKKSGTTTIAGNYSGAGFSGGLNTPWTQKGGWFRSNKSGANTQALSGDQQNSLNGLMMPAVSAFGKLIAVSGEAARSLDGWGFAINRAIANDADMKTLQIDIANSMGAKLLPELEKFRAKGESLADTAVRMADTYMFTDLIFKTLGFTAANTGIASLKMRDSLVALMGGFSAANATMDSYYKNFFTGAEQHANSLRQLTAQFEFLGVAVPKTRNEFRKMSEVMVQDTTPAGQALFAALMKLNPAFAAITQSADDLATAASNDLTEAYNRESSALQTTIDKFAGFSKSLLAFRDSLYGGSLSTLSPEAKYLAAKANFASVSAQAQAGDEDAINSLQGVSQQFLESSRDYNASTTAYASDFEAVQAGLRLSARAAMAQSSIALAQLTELKTSVKGLITVNDSVLSVRDAIIELNSVLAAQTAIAAIPAGGTIALNPIGTTYAGTGSEIKTIQDLYSVILGRVGEAAGLAHWEKELMGDGVIDAAERQLFATSAIPELQTLRGFADGSNVIPFDMTARIHKGEQIKPAKYVDMDRTDREVTNKLLSDVLMELRADKTQRAAVSDATLEKLDAVIDHAAATKRELARAA